MAKLALLFALFLLPAVAFAGHRHHHRRQGPFMVSGKVYCDHCRAGFETSASTYIAGAKVKIECRNRKTSELLYTRDATTDSTGTYMIPVHEDHKDQCCDAMLVSSPHPTCNIPTEGRDKARVILTSNNGIVSDLRYANNMGFMTAEPMAGCTQILQQYQDFED